MNDARVFLSSAGANAAADGARAADRAALDAHRMAWQREMEKAQSDAWFKVTRLADSRSRPESAEGAAVTTNDGSPSRGPGIDSRIPEQTRGDRDLTTVDDEATAARPDSGTRSTASAASLHATSAVSPSHLAPDSGRVATEDGGRAIEPAASPPTAIGLPVTGASPESARTSTAPIANSPSVLVGASSARAGSTASEPSTATLISSRDEVGTRVDVPTAAEGPSALETNVVVDESSEALQFSSSASAPDAKRLAATLARALDPLPPVRLHVEWSGATARVWIGLDAPATSHLPALVANLARWMDRAGTRLRSVTCNGSVCFASPPGAPTSSLVAGTARPEAAQILSTVVDVIVEKEN